MSSGLVMTIAVVGGVIWLAFLAVSAIRGRGREEVPPNLAPGRTDDDLEITRLDRYQKAAVLLSGFMAVFLPLYFLGEDARQESFVSQFDEEQLTRGEHIVAEFKCFDCHGPNGLGGSANYIDRRTGVTVSWAAPSLNDIFYRHTADEVSFWVTYGRGNTPMPAWGLAGGGPLSTKQVDDVVAYLQSIQISQQEVLSEIQGTVSAELTKLERAGETVQAELRDQEQLIADIEKAPALSAQAQPIAAEAAESLADAGEGLDTDGDGLSDASEVEISTATSDFNAVYDLPGLVRRTYDPANAESTGAPDRETAEADTANLGELAVTNPILEVAAGQAEAALALTGEDQDGDGLTDEAEAQMTATLSQAYSAVRPGNLVVVRLDPTNPESVPLQPDAKTAAEAVAALESIALQLEVTTNNQASLLTAAEEGLAAVRNLAIGRAWEIDLEGVAESAFEGDVARAQRAVGLFNGYCARCHTSGWSEGVLYTQEAGAGALGPALFDGRENVQFLSDQQLLQFITNGSEPQKAYGVNGFGTGRMPAFGMVLTEDDLELLVAYLRAGNLDGKGD